MSSNPWESDVVTVPAVPGLGMVSAGPAASSVNVAGLDFMGFRVADAGVRRFVSTDALSSVPGITHGMDVNSFVGWNPISLVDPWGLRPMSVIDFREHQASGFRQRSEANAAGATGLRDLGRFFFFGPLVFGSAAVYFADREVWDDTFSPKIEDLNVHRQYGQSGNIPSVPPKSDYEVAQRMNSVNDNPHVKEMEKSEENKGYSSVQIDVYKNKNTGQRIAYVYIPGTDFGDMSKQGELGSIGNNLGLGANTSDKPIDELSPYHRMVENAMHQAGIMGMDQVVLVGHSQGGSVAYSLANNKEFNSKYKVSSVVTYGSPVANLEMQREDLQHKFNYVSVVNSQDPVPSLAPQNKSEIKDPAQEIHVVESPNVSGVLGPHDMNVYVDATRNNISNGHGYDTAVHIDTEDYVALADNPNEREGTGLYTGTNTSKSNSITRGAYELYKS